MAVKYLTFPQVPWKQDDRLCNKHIQVGEVVIVHGLKKRPELNDRRAIVLQEVDDGSRWLVKVLSYNNPIAVKPSNLNLPPQPAYESHPESMSMYMWQTKHINDHPKFLELSAGIKSRVKARGVTYASDPPEEQAQKLAELLACHSEGFSPNQTILLGVAGKYYGAIPGSSMQNFIQQNMEHNCGILALMDLCQQEHLERGLIESEKEHVGNIAAVIAALLENNPVSFQALFQSIACPPYIGPIEEEPAIHQDAVNRCCSSSDLKEWKITPPQTHKDYIRLMLGYYLLLQFITAHTRETDLGKVFLRVIEKHDLFPLFCERSVNLVAREIMGTSDGVALGHTVRVVLANICYMSGNCCEHFYVYLAKKETPTLFPVKKLLMAKDITSCEELARFLTLLTNE